MNRKSISYFTASRKPLSLREVPMFSDKDISDLFFAVDDAENLAELHDNLDRVIDTMFWTVKITDNLIRLKIPVYRNGNIVSTYLQIRFK